MKFPHRREFLHLAAGAAALPAFSHIARAQAWPTRPITIVVPFPAGGASDAIGRTLGERIRASLGQPVIIENVSGANGNIGVGRVARAIPDGYTLSLGSWNTHVSNGALYVLQYDVLNDFEPVALLASTSLVMVAKKAMPANNLKEFIAWLKANPDKASQGIAGVGSMGQLSGIHFQNATATRVQHVPYRGSAPAMQDLVAGQVDMMIDVPAITTAAGACRLYQGLCRNGQEPLGSGTGYPDGRRSGIAGFPCLTVVCALGTRRHPEGRNRSAQYCGCECFGRPDSTSKAFRPGLRNSST